MVDEPKASEIRMAKMYKNFGKNLDHRVESAFGAKVSSMITHSWHQRLGSGGARERRFGMAEAMGGPLFARVVGALQEPRVRGLCVRASL